MDGLVGLVGERGGFQALDASSKKGHGTRRRSRFDQGWFSQHSTTTDGPNVSAASRAPSRALLLKQGTCGVASRCN